MAETITIILLLLMVTANITLIIKVNKLLPKKEKEDEWNGFIY